jgi:hypothetical protein
MSVFFNAVDDDVLDTVDDDGDNSTDKTIMDDLAPASQPLRKNSRKANPKRFGLFLLKK